MEKSEVYEYLENCGFEIAEVICDIELNNRRYNNQSILVVLAEEPSNDDLIKPSEHWWTCRSIDELFGSMSFSKVKAIKNIREFKTDFK